MASTGVRANALAPGWFRSELTSGLLGDEAGNRWVARRTPMGRAGTEGELDGALLYLASDASTYTTGTTLTVDGGYSAVRPDAGSEPAPSRPPTPFGPEDPRPDSPR